MKKKILTLMFTLVLLIGLVAALGMNASAATANVEISAATGVNGYDNLASYLDQLRPKTYFKLTSDIIVTDDTKDLSLPVDASGTFVLDLNGYEIIINSDKTTSVFNIGSYFSTEFHVINSSTTRSGITLNSITDGASVFYINDERSSLHIYDGIDIGVCLNGNYFGSQSLSPATLCGIRANKFDTIALHGADIYNRSSYGIGIRFDSDASGSKLILDGDVEISSKNAALDFRGISTAYPTVTIKTLHAKYEDALPVNASNYSTVSEYIAIKGMPGTAKFSDIAPSGTNGFYGTNADTSYSLFINDTDYINNSKYKGKNISISYPSCGHSQGYECYLRLFVPGKIRPLHFTVCSYCGEKAAYNICTFATKVEATSEAHGHTAGYNCYCGYKTTQTLHYYEEYAKKAATCTTSGYKETMYACRICTTYYDSNKNQIHGKAFLQNRIAPLGHDMKAVSAVDATCTKDGNIAHYDCSRCDLITSDAEGKTAITSIETKALGHKWSAATCTKAKTCSVCNATSGSALGHKWSAATCTKAKTCSVCKTTSGSALGHKWSAATCTKAKTCSVCKATSGSALGHKWTAATCTKAKTCSVCKATEGKALGHKWAAATCTKAKTCSVCKATSGSALGHKWTAATCTKAKTCSVCKATSGKALGHKYSNACDTSCNTCKATRKITHSYKSTTTKATLTKNGKVVNKCTVCGNVKSTTTVYYPKTIKLSKTAYTYNGKVQKPSVTVKDSKGNTLKKDTDYTVKYASGNKNTGKYSVTITFKGKYSGTKTLYFNILPSKTSKISITASTTSLKATWKKVTGASGYKVELLNSKGKVVKSITTTKLTYTFKKLSKVTTYKVRVTAYKTIDKKAAYSTVSTTITTSTAPAKVTLSKVTAGSKQATVAWKTVSGASGYEVQYSTSSEFKSAKTATVKKGSSSKTTIKKLTKGKKYYFKVRAYKTVGDAKIYSAWSAVKSVKIK